MAFISPLHKTKQQHMKKVSCHPVICSIVSSATSATKFKVQSWEPTLEKLMEKFQHQYVLWYHHVGGFVGNRVRQEMGDTAGSVGTRLRPILFP